MLVRFSKNNFGRKLSGYILSIIYIDTKKIYNKQSIEEQKRTRKKRDKGREGIRGEIAGAITYGIRKVKIKLPGEM